METKNSQAKPINQKRGPTTGNAGNTTKRSEFISDKAKSGSQKSELANMVTKALEGRGRGQAGKTNPALEGVKSNVNVGRGPTRGNK